MVRVGFFFVDFIKIRVISIIVIIIIVVIIYIGFCCWLLNSGRRGELKGISFWRFYYLGEIEV